MANTFKGVTVPPLITLKFVLALEAHWQKPTGASPYLCDCVWAISGGYASDEAAQWAKLLNELDLGTGCGVFEDFNLEGNAKFEHLININAGGDNNTIPAAWTVSIRTLKKRRQAFLNELKEALAPRLHGVKIPEWLTLDVLKRLALEVRKEDSGHSQGYLCIAVRDIMGEDAFFTTQPRPCTDSFQAFLRHLGLGDGLGVFRRYNLRESDFHDLANLYTQTTNLGENESRLRFLNRIAEALL